jgi:hypothetical protein
MAVIHLEGRLSLIQTIDLIKTELPNRALSLEMVDEGYIKGETLVYLIVFEKYFMRVSNRVSLSIMLSEVNHKTQIVAISSGAGTGALFKFGWGSEEDFLSDFVRFMEGYYFMQI